jgi:hypothetical protein
MEPPNINSSHKHISQRLRMAGIEGFCWSRPLALELKRGGVSPDMNPRQILQGRHDEYIQTRWHFELQHPGEACCAESRAR